MTTWILIFWAATWYPNSAFSTSFTHTFKSETACKEAAQMLKSKDDVRVAVCIQDKGE